MWTQGEEQREKSEKKEEGGAASPSRDFLGSGIATHDYVSQHWGCRPAGTGMYILWELNVFKETQGQMVY